MAICIADLKGDGWCFYPVAAIFHCVFVYKVSSCHTNFVLMAKMYLQGPEWTPFPQKCVIGSELIGIAFFQVSKGLFSLFHSFPVEAMVLL